nr:hypothetical protein [Tanacetum cinerariifolium]
MTQVSPEQFFCQQQQQAFHNRQLNNLFQNLQYQQNAPFQNLQKQREAFQQSQPPPQFKEPQPPTKDNRRGKRMAKRATMDWPRMARRKSRLASVHVGHVKKKFCYLGVGSKPPRTTKSEPTKPRIRFGDILWKISTMDLRHKLQAGTSAYEAKKAKEMAMIEFKEMEFLTIDAESLSEPKASIIRNRQEKIIAKYTQQ